MKKRILIGAGLVLGVLAAAAGVFYLVVLRPAFAAQQHVREMAIERVDLTRVVDGTYTGSFTYSITTTTVRIAVKNHAIERIDVLERGPTEYAEKAASGMAKRVKEAQSLELDAVAGATTSSKALLKAMEIALKKGLSAGGAQ